MRRPAWQTLSKVFDISGATASKCSKPKQFYQAQDGQQACYLKYFLLDTRSDTRFTWQNFITTHLSLTFPNTGNKHKAWITRFFRRDIENNS